MGCAPSCAPSPQDTTADEFAPLPPIPVHIGSGVRRHPVQDTAIIFIFGGPGSLKGLVIEELTQRFNFVPISVDEIIFTYLPNKVSNVVETTGEILQLIKNEPSVLTMDWILSMISARMTTSYLQRFIVDIVPEFPIIARSECFTSRNHDKCLEKFERSCPVMFALDLKVLDDNISEGKKDAPAGPPLSKELRTVMNGALDDIDKGRLQRRIEMSHKCSLPFLSYFNDTKRVVRLTLAGPQTNTVSTVRQILADFGFTYLGQPQRVILFAMRDHFFNDIDLDYYKMKRIRLSDAVRSRREDMPTQLSKLRKYIQRSALDDDNFAVHLDTLSKPAGAPSKQILFYDKTLTYLDEFIKNKNTSRAPSHRERIAVQVMASTVDDILLFIDPFPEDVMRELSRIYAGDAVEKHTERRVSMSGFKPKHGSRRMLSRHDAESTL